MESYLRLVMHKSQFIINCQALVGIQPTGVMDAATEKAIDAAGGLKGLYDLSQLDAAVDDVLDKMADDPEGWKRLGR